MLENNYSTQIEELLARLPCGVRIPAEWNDYFSQDGILPAIDNDQRRRARKHYRVKAALELKATLPAINRQPSVHAVYTRDISHDSISFLHTEQLYPGEVCRLWLTERRLQVTVVRCSRVNSQCYVVGGTFE